jgi:hypothetical protein
MNLDLRKELKVLKPSAKGGLPKREKKKKKFVREKPSVCEKNSKELKMSRGRGVTILHIKNIC